MANTRRHYQRRGSADDVVDVGLRPEQFADHFLVVGTRCDRKGSVVLRGRVDVSLGESVCVCVCVCVCCLGCVNFDKMCIL